jgi:hypothetical protein
MVSVVSAAFLDKWLLLYHAMLLNRVRRRTTWQKQIDIAPYLILGLRTSDVPLASWSGTPFNPDLQDRAIPTVLRP